MIIDPYNNINGTIFVLHQWDVFLNLKQEMFITQYPYLHAGNEGLTTGLAIPSGTNIQPVEV